MPLAAAEVYLFTWKGHLCFLPGLPWLRMGSWRLPEVRLLSLLPALIAVRNHKGVRGFTCRFLMTRLAAAYAVIVLSNMPFWVLLIHVCHQHPPINGMLSGRWVGQAEMEALATSVRKVARLLWALHLSFLDGFDEVRAPGRLNLLLVAWCGVAGHSSSSGWSTMSSNFAEENHRGSYGR